MINTSDTSSENLVSSGNIILIANAISARTKTNLIRSDVPTIQNMIRSVDLSRWRGRSVMEFNHSIVEMFIGQTKSCDQDTKAYMISEISQLTDNENSYKYSAHANRTGTAAIQVDTIQKFTDNIPALQTFNNITLPRMILSLDSRSRVLGTNTLRWNLNDSGYPGMQGDIWLQDVLKEIIAVKIYPFWIPAVPGIDYYGKIRMQIVEFFQRAEATQFLQGAPLVNGYQFEFNITEVTPKRLYLTPVNSVYRFHEPVAQLSSISVVLLNPFTAVQLPDDSGVYTVTPGPVTIFTGANSLGSGDLVYISGFAGNTAVNSESGYYITKISGSSWSIPVDSSGSAPGTASVFYGSRRILFEMEFTSLEK